MHYKKPAYFQRAIGSDIFEKTFGHLHSPEELEPFAMPAENGLRLDDQEGRPPLTPDFGKPDPEEAIAKAQLRSRMAALIDGQLLSESKILQSQTLTVSECVGEYIDEGK